MDAATVIVVKNRLAVLIKKWGIHNRTVALSQNDFAERHKNFCLFLSDGVRRRNVCEIPLVLISPIFGCCGTGY
jgi:hypothetical protein